MKCEHITITNLFTASQTLIVTGMFPLLCKRWEEDRAPGDPGQCQLSTVIVHLQIL